MAGSTGISCTFHDIRRHCWRPQAEGFCCCRVSIQLKENYETFPKEGNQTSHGYHQSIPKRQTGRQCMSSLAVPTAASSNALLHLRDVKFNMALHLHVLFTSTLHFVLDLLFEIDHLGEVLA